jgi:hypothetical protein
MLNKARSHGGSDPRISRFEDLPRNYAGAPKGCIPQSGHTARSRGCDPDRVCDGVVNWFCDGIVDRVCDGVVDQFCSCACRSDREGSADPA